MVSRRSRLGRIAWEQYYLPREIRHLGLDLLHSPTGIAPARPGCASVVTLHDLAFRRYPELFHWSQGVYLRRILPKSAQRAAAVITDSAGVREEIISELRIDPATVFSIPLGVSTDFKPVDDPEQLHPGPAKIPVTE